MKHCYIKKRTEIPDNLMTADIVNIKKEFHFNLALVSAGGFGMLLCNFIYENTNS